MTLLQAAVVLKNKKVTVITARGDITGTLKQIGDDFVDVEAQTTKSTLIPAREILALKEN